MSTPRQLFNPQLTVTTVPLGNGQCCYTVDKALLQPERMVAWANAQKEAFRPVGFSAYPGQFVYLFGNERLGGTGFFEPTRPDDEMAALFADASALSAAEFSARHDIAPGYPHDSNPLLPAHRQRAGALEPHDVLRRHHPAHGRHPPAAAAQRRSAARPAHPASSPAVATPAESRRRNRTRPPSGRIAADARGDVVA